MRRFEYKVIGESTVNEHNKKQKKDNPKTYKPVGFVEIFNLAGIEGWRLTSVNIGKLSNFVMEREFLDDEKTQPIDITDGMGRLITNT